MPCERPGPGRARARWRGASSLTRRALWIAGLLALTAWNLTRSDALGEAEAAHRRGDDVTVVERAKDHLDRRPWSRRAARLVALGLSRLDFADEAEPYYRRAGRLGLDDLHIRAYGLVRGDHRRRAEAAYREILAIRPDDPLALRRLGAELMTMTRWSEALEVAERLSRTRGGEVDGLAMIGAIQHHLDKAEAAAAYLRVLEIDPRLRRLPSTPAFRRVFWAQLTEDLFAIGRPAEARGLLERAPPGDRGPTLTWLLGQAYSHEGAFEEVERHWREAVQGEPGLTDAWVDLGRLALVQGRTEEAIAALERAVAPAPRAYVPSHLLSVAFGCLGRKDLADRHQKNAERYRLESAPGPVGSNPSRGRVPPSA